jgi:NhaA family Na+:H+ antiporter
MPAFAFANAGVSLGGLSVDALLAPVPLGIALGLFLGKQAGVAGFAWLGVRLGFCRLPSGTTWRQMYAVALLAGIGFTMSLFIGTLAFTDPATTNGVRLGVLTGSIASGVIGFVMLRRAIGGRVGAAADRPRAPRGAEPVMVEEFRR